MMNKFKILFHLRLSKANDNTATIYCRLTLNNKRIEVCSTYIKISLNEWNYDAHRLKKTTENSIKNARLNEIESKLEAIVFDLNIKGIKSTANSVKNLFLGKTKSNYSYVEIKDLFLKEIQTVAEIKNKTGIGKYCVGTFNAYKAKNDNFIQFLTEKKRLDLPAEETTKGILKQYESWHLLKGNSEAYAKKNCRVVKTVINWACENEYINTNPLMLTKIRVPNNKELVFLSKEEVQKIENYSNFTLALQNVADCFLFQCYTGLAYTDLRSLTPADIKIIEGRMCIVSNRNKTQTDFTIPLISKALKLLEKYGGIHSFVFPIRSNAKMNLLLKVIMEKVGINKNITTHTGRKTFTDTLINEYNMTATATIGATGHRNEKELNAYYRLRPKRVLAEFPVL